MVRLCCCACEAAIGVVVVDAALPEIETDIGDMAPVPELPSSVPPAPVPLPAEGEFSESDVTVGWLLTFMLDPSILTE